MKKLLATLAVAFALTSVGMAASEYVNYQGRINDAGGQPMVNGAYTMEFRIYDQPTDGNLIWGPFLFDGTVGVGHGDLINISGGGRFNVILGPEDVDGDKLSSAFPHGGDRFVELTVGAGGSPILPRQQFLTTPFAFQASNGSPPGAVMSFAGPAAPAGWLICDGTSVSRTEYAELFAAIGTSWGSASPDHFNLPDLRGRVSVGAGENHDAGLSNRLFGSTGGEETHRLTVPEMPTHSHSVTDPGHHHGFSIGSGDAGDRDRAADGDNHTKDVDTADAFTNISINSSGGSQAHNNMQPFAVLNSIIKY